VNEALAECDAAAVDEPVAAFALGDSRADSDSPRLALVEPDGDEL
jgi:hypothetical protein